MQNEDAIRAQLAKAQALWEDRASAYRAETNTTARRAQLSYLGTIETKIHTLKWVLGEVSMPEGLTK